MKPPPLAYARPASIAEAYELLADGEADFDAEAKVLAGGQSLIPLLNLRLARPSVLVDIRDLTELASVQVDDHGALHIGALVTQQVAGAHAAIRSQCPLLVEASSFVGHPQIRSRGTIVGSAVHADPSAEMPAVLRLLDATVRLGSTKGERTVAAADFFDDYYTTTIAPTELALVVTVPPAPAEAGWCFTEFSQRRGDFAIVGVACLVRADGGTLSEVRVTVAGCGGVPARFADFEVEFVGRIADEATFGELADAIADRVRPASDPRSPAAYRIRLTRHLVRQALRTAYARTGAGSALNGSAR